MDILRARPAHPYPGARPRSEARLLDLGAHGGRAQGVDRSDPAGVWLHAEPSGVDGVQQLDRPRDRAEDSASATAADRQPHRDAIGDADVRRVVSATELL